MTKKIANKKIQSRLTRHARIRKKAAGTNTKPRLVVNRSNRHIHAQIIDDAKSQTLAYTSSQKIEKKGEGKLETAFEVGLALAKKATDAKIKRVVFDRAGYRYHGRVKALAEGARKGGLDF